MSCSIQVLLFLAVTSNYNMTSVNAQVLTYKHSHPPTYPHTHTRTHACTCTYTCYTTVKTWLHGPINMVAKPTGVSKNGGTIGCRYTNPIYHPATWSPQSSMGTHLWACKTHEMRDVEYSLE